MSSEADGAGTQQRAPLRLSVGEILNPRSVAVFGASDNRNKFGGRVMHFLDRHGFPGRIVPVNRRRAVVFGRPAFSHIGQAPGPVDVAILAVPAGELPASVAECAEAEVGCCVIMTTGFAEAGEDGATRQAELTAIGRRSGMRILGPNCLGLINPLAHLALCSSVVLDVDALLVGEIGLVSQSGALMVSMLDRAYGEGIGFSTCVSLGNQADLEICDFLEYLIAEPRTRAICLYVEGFVDPARFLRAAATCREAGKPLLMLKTGRTDAGVRAARSHTASLAGSYAALATACRELGVLLCDDPDAMVRTANLLVRWPHVGGDGIGVISSSGGSAGILVDRLTERGLRLAKLGSATRAALADILLPPQADNPIDLGGRRPPESVEIADAAMRTLAADRDVSIIFLSLSSMPFFEPRTRLLAAEALAGGKPVICSVLPGPAADAPRRTLRELGCPYFDSINDALHVLDLIVEYRRLAVSRGTEPRTRPPGLPTLATDLLPSEDEPMPVALRALLSRYGIPLADERLATDEETAVAAAAAIGFPVALKGIARELVHKSDAGAVRLDLKDDDAVRRSWHEIAGRLRTCTRYGDFQGCIVQKMIRGAAELIVGVRRDEQYGPFVLVGFGGVLVEFLHDVQLAPAPVSPRRASTLLRSLRLAPLFDGVRGQPALDLSAASEIVCRVSWLAADLGDHLVDLEVNPVVLRPCGEGAVGVDLRGTVIPSRRM